MKRALIVLALVVVLALPFALRTPSAPTTAGADDTLVIVTPHNEAIRYEFGQAFARWYQARTGRTVAIDWRVLGGTSEIARFLDGEYITAFQNHWVNKLGKPWSAEVQAGSQNGRLPADAPAIVKEARAAFLASDVSCGIDLFFGGGTYDFAKQATAGRFVPTRVVKTHPEWFTDDVIPRLYAGEEYWDKNGLWIGCVLSSYGIIFNRDSLQRLGATREPEQWDDLTDFRFYGEVALCDPTKSGSIAKAFENVIQQRMQRHLKALRAAQPNGDAKALEAQAVRAGWTDGLRLLQLVGANSRYFTDTSQKPPIDVSVGNCAVGMCIDFYGRAQAESASKRGGSDRLGYISPPGGTVSSVDPIGLLRGAPHREPAELFIEFVLSMDGQHLWNEKPGTPRGPERYALRRLPVRKDYYVHAEWQADRSDRDANPFEQKDPLIYRPEWSGGVFREMAFIIRVMCQDTHEELREAWRAIHAPGIDPARRARALAVLQDLSAVSYDRTLKEIKSALSSKNKVDEVTLANDLAGKFRAQYARATAIARGKAE
ncbi:ABC transporter substrate-binding protein [Oleiharenicola sp. Vm1]|uniref:ABC transporter substrate-binding protein n=1 Tax=Oleiharenicola sp. Vm1 TaxID=3398393 RepID=UPI0039F5C57F